MAAARSRAYRDYSRERKCADTIGTVLIPWADHFRCYNININIFFK